ncbi:Diacylglycerol kinase [Balamuthia mandrillaris]
MSSVMPSFLWGTSSASPAASTAATGVSPASPTPSQPSSPPHDDDYASDDEEDIFKTTEEEESETLRPKVEKKEKEAEETNDDDDDEHLAPLLHPQTGKETEEESVEATTSFLGGILSPRAFSFLKDQPQRSTNSINEKREMKANGSDGGRNRRQTIVSGGGGLTPPRARAFSDGEDEERLQRGGIKSLSLMKDRRFTAKGEEEEQEEEKKEKEGEEERKEEEENIRGHRLRPVRFAVPTYCDHCGNLIWNSWSTTKGALQCAECAYVCHMECKHKLSKECRQTLVSASSVAAQNDDSSDQKGVHTFYEKFFSKRVYCNYCRKLIVSIGKQGKICAVCKYAVHHDCAPMAECNCPELYISDEEQERELPTHHWIEGNLDAGHTCLYCTQAISTGRGMTGFKCFWCKGTMHNECRDKLPNVCTLGYFVSFKVPPTAITRNKDKTSPCRWKINPNKVNNTAKPILVLLNRRSGAQQGGFVHRRFSQLLNPLQIHDLSEGGPVPGLQMFEPLLANKGGFYVVACGGDGTVGWVCEAIDQQRFQEKYNCTPCIVPLPLGTGNDLSRTLGWGPGYQNEDLEPFLRSMEQAKPVWMDRWKVRIIPLETPELDTVTAKDKDVQKVLVSSISDEKQRRQKALKEQLKSNQIQLGEEEKALVDVLLNRDISNIGKSNSNDNNADETEHEMEGEAESNASSSASSTSSNESETLLQKDKLKENETDHSTKEETEEQLQDEAEGKEGKEDDEETNALNYQSREKLFNNYFSVGIDAKVALDFHIAREKNPKNFNSRGYNKWKYFHYGAASVLDGFGGGGLKNKIKCLLIDGEPVELPASVEGLVLLNLSSYASGTNPWGTLTAKERKLFHPQAIDDQLLEVVGITGTIHLAQIRTGTSSGIKLGQGKSIHMILETHLPVQADGEPWLQVPCVVEISHHNQVRMLKKSVASSSLFW